MTRQHLEPGRVRRVHVRQDRLRAQARGESTDPVLVVQSSAGPTYGNVVRMVCQCGEEAGRVVFRARPLSCGARAFVESTSALVVESEPEA